MSSQVRTKVRTETENLVHFGSQSYNEKLYVLAALGIHDCKDGTSTDQLVNGNKNVQETYLRPDEI
jgi:hypothetical protein